MPVQSEVDVCNLAQDLLGAERLASIDAPNSANERRYALHFPIVYEAELRKRRWHFAKVLSPLTPTGDPIVTDKQTLYRYAWPGAAVRVIRETDSDWIMGGGRQILSETSGTLRVWFIEKVSIALADPLFVLALSARLAERLCEAVTQSNEKKAVAAEQYKLAIDDARVANAFEIGSENIAASDASFSWLNDRRL